ncbi:hypothetical protein CcI49_02955 [Frankia sp. CcI49]|uniref:excisionase family DNA-binding protein n=1 Tax=Frankia sp. CcI49 TaxID=1745382 RepID=UPI000976DC04|nr:helix-turn-helix domain-containing protein [Frankia sp. CcI49]ONH62354.1 hypothetical protein CcI49_02955 [Frankia sp. CcI49]
MLHSAVRLADQPAAPARLLRRPTLIATGLASRLLGVSDKTAVKMAEDNGLTVVRTGGGHRRYHLDEIEALAQRGSAPVARASAA